MCHSYCRGVMKTVVFLLLILFVSKIGLAESSVLINGAGATFPYPLYSKWFYEYQRIHPELKFNYQSIGSGGGIQQIQARTVDFGASDAPVSDKDLVGMSNKLIHIPTVLGSVVVAYNQDLGGADLRLTGPVLSEIYLGQITKWDDPKIAAINAGVKLPHQEILVIHRSDGSGTTYVFTDYLSKISESWKGQVGTGKSVNWPAGLGGKGNEGVSGLIKQMTGALGYVELSYAIQNKFAMASLQNKVGQFVKPSIQTTSFAASSVNMPNDYRVSLTNADGKDAYPICSFTYLLVYQIQLDPVKGRALVDFLTWAIHDGQKMAGPLSYAPLPDAVVKKLEETIQSIQVKDGHL